MVVAEFRLRNRGLRKGHLSYVHVQIYKKIAMPSPFPGMDPYLEDPEIFPDFHDSFDDLPSGKLAGESA